MSQLRVVLYQEENLWVAQGLEVDIRAQGSSIDQAQARFDAVFDAEMEFTKERHGKAFAGIGEAPEVFFKMWDDAPGSFSPKEDGRAYETALCA